MSEDEETSSWCCISCCASCGIASVDDIELEECDNCDLVQYCGDTCQELHRPEHEEDCKKRAAELRDELLFKQPESRHLGDCPICCVPLPLDETKSNMMSCCSKVICKGCASVIKLEQSLLHSCPFCRKPVPKTEEECHRRRMKRIEANDPVAIYQEGGRHLMKGEYHRAFEYFAKAAALGDVGAHYQLSVMYRLGDGVEKDKGKEMHHLEEAAIGGHPCARHNLGCKEKEDGNIERAVKHWIIAAIQGHDDAIKCLMEAFKQGQVRKDDLATALRAHQAAVDATKSPQRKEAEEVERRRVLAKGKGQRSLKGPPLNNAEMANRSVLYLVSRKKQ